jgi:hypothetical protein
MTKMQVNSLWLGRDDSTHFSNQLVAGKYRLPGRRLLFRYLLPYNVG